MSRDGQTLQRNLRREALRDDGVPLNEEQRALYILTERQLIGWMSERMTFIDTTRSKTDCECRSALIISEVYHDWFHEQVNILLEERFVNIYKGTHGPRNLFQALFPDQEIDDFVRRNLNIPVVEHLKEAELRAVTNAEIERVIESRGRQIRLSAL